MKIELFQGDCLEMMKDITGFAVDLVLTDPPYGATRCMWDRVIPAAPMWKQLRRITKQNAAILLFGGGMFTAKMMQSASDIWRYNMIWHKTTPTGFLNANRMPLRAHEDIMVFYRRLPTYNPQKTTGHIRKVSTVEHKRNSKHGDSYGVYKPAGYDSTERFPTSVLIFSTDKQRCAMHPAQKPVALLENLILTYTNLDDTVLDFAMGSGSTGIACIHTGRNFIGIEKDAQIFFAAKQRIEAEQRAGPAKEEML